MAKITNEYHVGCYKDLEGTQPCKDGDRVALYVCGDIRMTQPAVSLRPVFDGETGTPLFSRSSDDGGEYMEQEDEHG